MADTDYNRRNKAPRPLSELEKERLEEFIDSIHYSARWVCQRKDFTFDSHVVSCIADHNLGTRITSTSTAMSNSRRQCWKRFQKTIMMHRRVHLNFSGRKNGGQSASHRVLAGNTTKCMNQSHISFFSSAYYLDNRTKNGWNTDMKSGDQ